MYRSVYDLKAFYNTDVGHMVQRVIGNYIRDIWPGTKGLRIMGRGYALPYLSLFEEECERLFSVMPREQGAYHWPSEEKNLTLLASESELPLEPASVDRILLMHDLEFAEHLRPSLAEIWRVLKPNGRLLVIVPNRAGMWSHAEWSPFGTGTPYTLSQICYYLKDNMFIQERTREALFMPPLRFSAALKSADFLEKIGSTFLPFAGGVHIVEASKQLYEGIYRGQTQSTKIRPGLVPKPLQS